MKNATINTIPAFQEGSFDKIVHLAVSNTWNTYTPYPTTSEVVRYQEKIGDADLLKRMMNLAKNANIATSKDFLIEKLKLLKNYLAE